MEGGNRQEAERWLYTANKLLSARDLHGAHSFALRARECDPRFDATELLLALIDTLMVAEARISEHHLDWYAILQVLRYNSNIDHIASQYRRLSYLLDPTRNPFVFSAHAYSLVQDAWSILSNPTKKAIYDNDLRLLTEPPPPPPPPPPQVVVPPPAPILPQAFPILQSQQNIQNNHHQNIQNQLQQQVQEQEIFSLSRNPRPNEARPVLEVEERPSLDNVTESTPQQTRPVQAVEPEPEVAGSFWTACPYCYVMYEYQKVYEECTLRCQTCRRAFHAVAIRSPPDLTGNDGSFCSWGFIPLGFSGDFKDISGSSSTWNPFSPLFPYPFKGASNRRYQKGPWVYHDDEAAAAFVELSDTTNDDSDDGDWRGGNKKGSKRTRKYRKSSAASAGGGDDIRRVPAVERPRRGVHSNGAGNAGDENGEAADAGSAPVPVAAVRPDTGKKAALVGSRKRGAGNMGKLDLNVEFSNEVEEPAHGAGQRNGNPNRAGNTEDNNIEGIGFFEGLDELFSSLPILNVVADDKVKGN